METEKQVEMEELLKEYRSLVNELTYEKSIQAVYIRKLETYIAELQNQVSEQSIVVAHEDVQ